MKLLSLFSGIGAFEKALDNLGIEYELVNYCEIDKYASLSYSLIHNVSESKNLGDITKVDTSKFPKDIDLITFGFPCQDISLAGKQQGFQKNDGSTTRSGLFFEALRIIEDTKPRIAIAENVKNLVSKKFNKEFNIVLNSLEKAGYNSYFEVLNSKDFGIPQNRERVFIVSIRKDIDKFNFFEPFMFPRKQELKLRLKDLLESQVDEKYFLSDKMISYISATGSKNFKNPDCKINLDITRHLKTNQNKRAGTTNYVSNDLPDNLDLSVIRKYGLFDKDGQTHQAGSVYDVDGLSPTLQTMQGGYRQPCIEETKLLIREKTKKGYALATDGDGVYVNRPHQKRGVVQKGMIQTIKANPDVGVVVKNEINVIGNYTPSGHDASRIVHPEGIAPTVKENHGTVTTTIVSNDKSLWTETQAKMITEDGNIKRYINSDKVDEFCEGQVGDISYPNGYNKGNRVYDVCPTINTQTTQSSFIVKVKDKKSYVFQKYENFYDKNNYIPEKFNPYNEKEIEDICPTLSTQCGSTTSSATVLIKDKAGNEIPLHSDAKQLVETIQNCELEQGKVLNLDLYNRASYEESQTLTLPHHNTQRLFDGLRIRKLTPKECFRLMGFSDDDFEKVNGKVSDTQLYKQAGNSIVVNVLMALFKRLQDEGLI